MTRTGTRTPEAGVVAGPATGRSYAGVPGDHPVHADRPVTGSKGEAWVVALPADATADQAVLAFETGVDGTTIVIGGLDGGPWIHPGHDLQVVVPAGSGTLRHGPDAARTVEERFTAPCTLVIPAGNRHAIAMDAGAPAPVAFFTRPGAVIDIFSEVGPRATQGSVRLADLVVNDAPRLPARVVPGLAAAVADGAAGKGPAAAAAPARPVRVLPYPQPENGYTLPLDTGEDTLFVMASRGASWDRAPVDVPVHRHDDEDEYIVLAGGEGWLLNGPTPETVKKVRYAGPCLLVMPAGNFHRVVREDGDIVDSVLVYAHRRALAAPWEEIVAELEVAAG